MTRTRKHSHGEQGVAVILTALCLIPLMVFAAFGVDLASWYSRVSYLQKAADAASLAGTVWMPKFDEARTAACASLKQNGIDGGDCGVGPFGVEIDRGSTPTALRVSVTDPDAARYFSQVLNGGQQSLTRHAEAEYNLPLPLGSPLNYFGGDESKIPDGTSTTTYGLAWPAAANSAARPPAVAQVGETQQAFSCNVGTASAQGYGRWTDSTSYDAGGYSGSTRCNYSVLFTLPGGTTDVPPPDYTRRAPTNPRCNVFQAGGNGRWQSGTTYNNNRRYGGSAANGNRQCTWQVAATTDLPVFYDGSNIPPGSVPINRPCRVGYETSLGWWGPGGSGAYSTSSVPNGGTAASGNRLCRWPAAITTTVTPPPPKPISVDRSPGFWAQIHGPGADQSSGDAYSTKCRTALNCGTPDNALYTDPSNPDQGYWYVVKVPQGGGGQTTIRVFDASLHSAGLDVNAGDSSITGDANFRTTYRVYRQTNPLDFNARTPQGSPSASTDPNSCNWELEREDEFDMQWVDLCTLNTLPGEVYLVNVRTATVSGWPSSAGRNGYAMEACLVTSCTEGVQPALYAYDKMVMYNNLSGGDSTFYIAEVAPQYAGKTLVLELWDPGESSGTAWLYPKKPSLTATGTPDFVDPSDCEFSSTRDGYPRGSDLSNGGHCSIRTASGGALYNGHWVTMRISIPFDYTCTPGVDPEEDPGSCWWGIQYSFPPGGQPTDTTTWQARIEGNPVHLTE